MDGKKHFTANTIIILSTFTFLSILKLDIVFYSLTGTVLGTLITPDYDFKNIYIKKVIEKIPIIGRLWNIYWLPYALMFTHRGYSHNIFIGTFSRILYLLLPLFILFIIINNKYNIYNITTNELFGFLIVVVSWYIQDLTHYALDSKIYSLVFTKKQDT
jgi:uncharacterized metal-binding protein